MSALARNTIVGLFIAAICTIFLIHYLVTGTSIFQFNSIGAISLLSLKINYDQFRDLNFIPKFWTPLYGAGGPTAIGVSSFNPLFLTTSWITPFENAVIGFEILMRAIGTAGLYCFLRSNSLAFAPALIAAGLFGFNVYASSAGQDPQIGLAVLFVPWCALAMQSAISRPTWAATCFLSLVFAVFYLISTTQIFSFTMLVLFAPFALILWMRDVRRGRDIAALKHEWRPVLSVIAAAALCTLLIAFDVASQISNLTVSLSTLDSTTQTRDYLFLAPISILLSVAIFVLARAESTPWRLLATAGMFLGYLKVYKFLGLSYLTVIAANFGGASLADFVFDQQKPRFFLTCFGAIFFLAGLTTLTRRVSAGYGALAAASIGAAYGLVILFVPPSPYYVRFVFVPILGAIVIASIGAGTIVNYLRDLISPQWRAAAVALLVLLATAEAANMSFRQTIYTDALKYTATSSPEMAFLAKLGPQARVIDTYENEHTEWLRKLPLDRPSLLRWLFPTFADAQTFSRVGVSFVPDGFQTFYDRALRKAYFGVRPDEWSPLLDIAAVTHLLSRDPPDRRFTVELRGPDYFVSRNPNAGPRVQLYHQADVVPDKIALDKLETTSAAGSPLAMVAPESAPAMRGLDRGATGNATITRYEDERIAISAKVTGRSLLVLADTYHPGWQAQIDGIPASVLRANVAFRGLLLEAGEHEIEFRFSPPLKNTLLILSLSILALQLATGLAFVLFALKSRQKSATR